jgi:hypothetical protein
MRSLGSVIGERDTEDARLPHSRRKGFQQAHQLCFTRMVFFGDMIKAQEAWTIRLQVLADARH